MSSDAVTSLLSLSIAAASAAPIIVQQPSLGSDSAPGSLNGTHGSFVSPPPISSSISNGKSHRRLASTGKARRRLSDAREAANRPSPAILASSPALAMASLSLSSSPPSNVNISASSSMTLTGASKVLASSQSVPLNDGSNIPHPTSTEAIDAKPIPIGSGKKRGVEHRCESCSKIYRHPSCLIKHRWEHTPHWREASKFVLSKHQQVQLLEAAAILSHLSPHASSLPEDRSLWPSFLSGGSLPPPDPSTLMSTSESKKTSSAASSTGTISAISSSVPAGYHRASSTGPRLHDYSIPTNVSGNGVTQLRPGLLGVSTAADNGNSTSISVTAKPMSVPLTVSDSWHSVRVSEGGAGWSLPRSSVRSASGSSRSRSGSASDEENESVDVDGDGDEFMYPPSYGRYGGRNSYRGPKMWKKEEEDFNTRFSVREEDEYEKDRDDLDSSKPEKVWDDMEMEMDMD